MRIRIGRQVRVEEGARLGFGGAGRRHVGGVTRRPLADANHTGPPVVAQRKSAAQGDVAQSATSTYTGRPNVVTSGRQPDTTAFEASKDPRKLYNLTCNMEQPSTPESCNKGQ